MSTLYSIRHKKSGLFLRPQGYHPDHLNHAWPLGEYYHDSYLTKRGKTWKMKFAVDAFWNQIIPEVQKDFEIVSYSISEVNESKGD